MKKKILILLYTYGLLGLCILVLCYIILNMKEILSYPSYAFGLFALCIFMGWLIFVKLFPRNILQWKKTDYIWISLSSIGLFGLLADNRIVFNKYELEICDNHIKLSSNEARIYIANNQYFCREFLKTENSPDNLEDIQKEYDNMCNWRELNEYRIDSMLRKQEIINIDDLEIPLVKYSLLNDMINDFIRHIKNYNHNIIEKQKKEAKISDHNFETEIKIFSPLFLILGLSIRFVKTIGEISLQKKNEK